MTRSADAVMTSCAPKAKPRFASAVTSAPIAMTRDGRTRSVSGRTTSTAAAYPRRYAETTHPSSALDAFQSVRMSGSAAAGSCEGRRTRARVAERASERERIRSSCKSLPIFILISNEWAIKVKQCSKCGETKPYSEFHKYKRGDGYQPWCKSCRKVYDHDYNLRNHRRWAE